VQLKEILESVGSSLVSLNRFGWLSDVFVAGSDIPEVVNKSNLKLWVVAGNSSSSGPKAAPQRDESVGFFLRSLRENQGITVDEVARQTRIRGAYIDAIEDDRFDALPGRAYALGFVRTYAEYLGADVEAAARSVQASIAGIPTPPLRARIPEAEREPRTAVAAAALVCLVLAGYVYWYFYNNKARFESAAETFAQADAPVFLDAAEPVPPIAAPYRPYKDLEPPVTRTVAALQLPTENKEARVTPLPPSRQIPTTETLTVEVKPANLPAKIDLAVDLPEPRLAMLQADQNWSIPAVGPAMASTGLSHAPVTHTRKPMSPSVDDGAALPQPAAGMVKLRAVVDTWIEIRSVKTGKILFSRVLREGEIYEVPDRTGLTMTAGNAGGLEVRVDDRLAPPIGKYGQVVRDLHLVANDLLAGRL